MVSAAHKIRAVRGVVAAGLCSMRKACGFLRLHRSSFRYVRRQPEEWLLRLHGRVEALSRRYPRLGSPKVARMLREDGWEVGRKLVARIRRECGLKVRRRPPRRRRRGRSTGPPTRAEWPNHVWSWDFIADRTDNGGKLRVLSVIDEYTRECLALHVARAIGSKEVIEVLERLVCEHGAPGHIRSDNGPEFIARELQRWLADRGIKTLYIDPGNPWQNGHVESFHSCMRDECLERELMLSLAEARVVIAEWRRHYNLERPHGAIGYRTPDRARRDAQALGFGRPPGSLRQGLDQNQTKPNNETESLTSFGPNKGTRSRGLKMPRARPESVTSCPSTVNPLAMSAQGMAPAWIASSRLIASKAASRMRWSSSSPMG